MHERIWRRAVVVLGLLAVLILPGMAGAMPAPGDDALRLTMYAAQPYELELALDEVQLAWPAGAESRAPILGPGVSVLASSSTGAALRLEGVGDVPALVARARAVAVANPGARVSFVVYAPGQARTAQTRRLLMDRVAVTREDGTTSFEVAADPLAVLELKARLAADPGVRGVGLVPVSEQVQQQLERKLAKVNGPRRFDQPQEAADFFVFKRAPAGTTAVPVEQWLQAREQMKHMPLRSTATRTTHPSAAALGLSLDATQALGAWTPLGPGNIGGRTRAIVIHPDFATNSTMYAAGVAGGVWKSTNAGASWTPLDDLMANLAISTLAMDPNDPNTLYAGTGEGVFNGDAVRGAGIFKTTNGGTTWTQLSSTANSNFYYVNKIVVSKGNSQRVYAVTRTGLWRSTDGGTAFTQLIVSNSTNGANGCMDVAIRTDITTSDNVIAACGTFAQARVHRSTDAGTGGGGFSIVLTEAGMGRTSLAIAPSDQATIYAAAADSGAGAFYALFRSGDGGATWTARSRVTDGGLTALLMSNPLYHFCLGFSSLNQGWYDNIVAVDPADPSRVWVGGIDLWRSDDAGLSWGQASHWWASTSNPRYAHADQHAIVFHPGYTGSTNQVMWVGNDGGLFRSSNPRAATGSDPCDDTTGSVNYTELNNSYAVTQFYHGLPYPGTSGGDTFFGGTQDNGTVRGTVAGGIDGWSGIQGGDGGYVAVDPTNTNILYAEFTGASIQRSTNGGSSFSDYNTGLDDGGFLFIAPFAMDPNAPSRLWAGGFTMRRTTTGTWTQASAVLCDSVSAIAVAPGNSNIVVSGTVDGCIHRTSVATTATSSTAWSFVTPRSAYVSWLAFDPSDINTIYATYATFGGSHVFKSTNGGASFTAIDGNLPDVPVHSIVVDPTNPSMLYIGTDVGVFTSTDGGTTWEVENTGFANVITEALAAGQVAGADTLFAFTHGRGAWRVALGVPGPDLRVTAATTTATTVAPGGTVNVANTVANTGNQDAGLATVAFALVPQPSGGDIPLAVTRGVTLAAGASSSATTVATIPAATPAGTYRIRVIADSEDAVVETSETNNTALTGTFTVARPDLVITVASATPTTVAAGGSVSVSNTVKNQGTITTGASFGVGFYLSADALLDGGDVAIGVTRTVAALGVNGTSAATTSVRISPSTAPGTYRILVVADPANAIDESNEANNVLATAAITVARPDLIVTVATAPAIPSATGTIAVSNTVKNQGSVTAPGPFAVAFYLSSDDTLGFGDVPLGATRTVASLAPNGTSSASTTLTIPPGPAPGVYRIIVNVDDLNAVVETDETNNTRASGPVTIGPDLVITAAGVTPTIVAPGGTVNVANTVKNVGGGATGVGFGVGFYLSTDATLDGGDVAVGVTRSVLPLAAGGMSAATTPVAIPPGTAPGSYRILVVADVGGAVIEASETNNVLASVPITVARGDLIVTAATATPGAVAPGGTVAVAHTVKNQGGVGTGVGFGVSFYLSTDPVLNLGGGPSDVNLGVTRTVTPLGPLALSTATTNVTIPPATATGLYYIIVNADDANAVVEQNEGNNTRATPIIVGPDVVVTAAGVFPTTVAPGGAVVVANTVKNQGAVATGGAFGVSFFLSTDGIFDGGDVPLGGTRTVAALAAGATSAQNTNVTIPGGTAPGPYRILVVADAAGLLPEANENNNVLASAPITVARPDLIVTAATGTPGAVAPGGTVAIANTVKNNSGIGTGGAFGVSFYLSTDNVLNVGGGLSDVALGVTRTVAALAANGLSSATTNVTIPIGTAPGVYYVIVNADDANAIVEQNETNNYRAIATPIVVGPDLVITAAGVSPTLVAPGATVNVANTVKNQGAVSTGVGFGVGFYLSTNATLDGGDVPIGVTRTVAALLPAGLSAATTAVTIPADTTPGTYRILVVADAAGVITEANEANNVLASVPITVAKPDLVVTAASAPAIGAVPGTTNIPVTFTVKNQGAISTGVGFGVSFYLSTDNVLDLGGGPSDINLGVTRTVGVLAPNGVYSTTSTVRVPLGTAPGLYFIIVNADDANVVAEANEANNTRATLTTVVVGNDLTVTAATPTPTVVAAGGTVSLVNTVKNQGTDPLGPFKVAFYLSTDGTLDAGDVAVGVTRTVTLLAAGGVNTATTPIPIPPLTAPGTYRILVFVDSENVVAEVEEANNVLATEAMIVVGPDLVVTAAGATPTTVAPGGTVNVANTVKNQGAVATGVGFGVGFYLSSDATLDSGDVAIGVTRTVAALAAGAMSAATSAVTIPLGTAPGPYRILVVVDVLGNVTEANETNNVRATVPVTVALPDLVVSAAAATSGAVAPGGIVSLANTVKNLGAVPAVGPFNVSFSLSTDNVFDGGDTPLGATRSVTVLGPAASSTATTPLVIPAGTSPGPYYIIVVADSTGAVTEQDEGNNTRATATPIVVGPDLTVTAASTVAAASPGATVTIGYTLRNQGAPAAGPFNVSFTLVPVLGGADIPLAPTPTVTLLGAGATLVASSVVFIPADVPAAEYRIRVTVDSDDVIAEADETNNSRLTTGPITVAQADVTPTTQVAAAGLDGGILIPGAATFEAVVPRTYTVSPTT